MPSLDDMDVAEYSEYEFKCNVWDVQQWVTQSVIGIPRVAMIFSDPLHLLECSVCQASVFPVSLSSPIVYWHCLIPRWYTLKFYDRSNNSWVSWKWTLAFNPQRTNWPFVKCLHHLGLKSIHSLKVAQSWF